MAVVRRQTIRAILAVAVLIITVVCFGYYFHAHPEVLRTLRHVNAGTLVLLLCLYAVLMGVLVWQQRIILALCDITLGPRENSLLVSYSTVINFFGPLQSGPGFRGAYLKKRHNVSLKRYTLATLVYYGLYAVFSGLLLISFAIGWWIAAIAAIMLLAAPLALRIRKFSRLDIRSVRWLAVATIAQILLLSVIYYVEIHSLTHGAGYMQTLAYTGAANFALFVSLTPGAIGFRETFLLFSQRLHHIGPATIAAASVIDRGVYIIFLLGLAAVIFGLHADSYLKKSKSKQQSDP